MTSTRLVFGMIVFNLIIIGAFLLITHMKVFDLWITNKVVPNLCTTQQEDGSTTFTYCAGEDSAE